MRVKRLVVLLIGLAAVAVVWVGLMAQSRETTYIVLLREKVSPSALIAMKGNRVAVKRALMETAKRTQPPLLARLQQWQQEGKVQHFHSLWIVNAVSVRATPEVIEALKRDPLVEKVIQARPVRLVRPIRRQSGIRPRQAFTWGLEKIRVPEVWNTFGIQGANVTVGVIDTGIAADHPDLVGKLRPVNGWFDPYGDTPSPSDWHGHGTHVSGTIAGGNASGTYIGVAPQATLIVAQLFNEDGQATDAAVLACMQWMMDPDGDPNTNDGADVVNNSWGYLYSHAPNMYDPIKDALNAWIAANIVPVFAIGNEGPSPRTTRSPGDYPMALGVGATDSNDNIADFSSRGPVFWEGIGEIIKPDVSAPGVYVYSSVPWGYEYWSGTSMASPHVAGTVALMISYARSQGGSLSVDTIKQLLKTTAVDLGQSGPDNDYGWGRIDAFAALMPLASDANEPNDNPSQATFIAFGETKVGKIEPDTDEDFFKFTGTQNTVITVKIDAQSLGSGIDAVLQILDSDGTTVLAESDDSNGSKDPYIAKFVLPHAGDFYIRITSKDFANELRHYALTLKLRSVPNLIATYNPQDNSVTLQWGSVFNSHRLASKRPMIRPLDLQGYRVYRATQAQGPYDLIASLPPDQTTYTDTNLPGQLVLYYRVTALYDEGESDPATARILADPTEPNDDPTTATQIAYGQSLQGTIAVSGDVDFYKFDGQAGDLVTVEVRAKVDGSSLDSVLTLYDSDGQTVLAFNDDFADWWWVTYDSKLVRFPLPHDGTFYLKVEDYWGSGSENHFYTLTLVRDTPDDHGDWPQNATPINAGENLPGRINPPPDTDYFVFNANAGDFIIAEIFARRQGSPLDPMLALYDEQGNLLAFNDDYYDLDSAIFYRSPRTGRYFLRVMPYGGPYRGGPDYTYTLSLTLLIPPRISVTPISIEETLLQGSRSVVSVNVANVGGESLTFFTRSATSAISTLSVQQPARRRIMFVPETSKLYQDYLRLRQQKQRELQQVIPKLLAKRDPNSQRLTQALQDSVVSPELIPLKGGKPISTLQNEQPPSGTWRWIIVDPDEYGEQQGNAINVTKVFYQSNGTYLYFRAELDGGNFDPQNAYFDIFLDTDRNAGTGDRRIVDGMGIDYILYGGLGWVGVFKFNPVTGNFEQVADFIWFKPVSGAVEVGVKLSDIGNPMDLHVACEFYDSNTWRWDSIPDIWYAPITREVPWLDRSPVAGSLLANESVNVELTLDSTSLGLGIHRANLVFNSNDLEKQQLTVPITLTIMQIPNVPDLISPADGAIVRPQVTFVLKSTDPDGDRVKFVIEARKGNEVKTYETEFVASGQEASLTVPEGLSSGEWTWRAKAIDERGQESSFSSEQTFIVNQLPTKPELIAPSNNAIVLPTPTFKVKGTDPDGDALKFKLVIKQGEQIVAVFDQTQQTIGWDKESYQSGEEATFTVPTNQRLTAGNYSWVAFAFDGKEWSEASEGRVIIVNQVVSVPELLSPISGAIVRPTVTFKLKSTDPDGDRVKFVIEARKGNEVKTYETEFVASGQEASLTVPEGLSSGEWTWRAKAIDERGQESSFSSEQTFIVNQLPTKPELIAPSNNAIVLPTPTFKVKGTDPDGDALKFKLVIKQGEQIVAVFDQTQQTIGWDKESYQSGEEATFTVPTNQRLTAGNYSWVAFAFDGKEWSEASEGRVIIVNQVVSVPELLSPISGAIVRPTVTFKLKSTDPDGDRVKFVIEARKGNEVKTYETEFVASGQEASLTVPEGLSSGEWTWRAKAIDERGQESSFSSEQTFIVNQLPTKPELIAPSNNAIVLPTPTFKVKGTDPDGDALKFKLVIKQGEQIVAVFDQTQQTIGWDKESYQSGEEATFTVPTNQRLTAGNYSWVAFAFDGKEWSEASEGRVIIVNQVVSVPELLSPISGAIVRPTVTFKLKSTDPDGDRVKFVIEARKGNEVKTYETEFVASGQEASLTVPEGLSSGEWTWRAKAIDERGQESSFSSEQTFIVNQLPTKPELIAPSNNAIVSTTPTFKLKSSDADGDQVKFEIEVAKGSRVEVLVTNFVNSGTEVSLIVPEDQSLSPGQWTWRARAIDARGEAGEWSDSRTIQVISVPLIRSGLRLVTCPVIGPADPKPVFAFDENKWAWFDPTSGYLLYPNSQTNLQVGKGYWAKFVQDTKPNVEGTLPDTNQPFSVALKKGWNLIGNPWLVDLVWDLSSIKVKVGGQEKALKDLGESEGVEPYAWRWDGSNYRLVYDTNVGIIGIDSALPSWEGAWVYAHTDCELILPPPSQGKGRGTRDRGQIVKGNGWSMRLQASVDGSVGEAVIGIANGTRGLAVGLPPEPPTGNNGVQVILLKNNTPLAVDVRNDGSKRQEWEVLVRFGTRDGGRGTSERKEVVLTFDGIGYAPKDVSAWLVDTVTGKRLYLRTQPSYRFVAQEGEVERKFKVVVERGNDRPLRVVGLKATPMRGQGVVIEFSLTKPAKVEAEVLTLTGRRVAVLDAGSSEGLTRRVVWRGVGIEGQKVGGGVYLIRVRAIDDEGRSTQGMTIVRTR
jgi:methionine-rich copper-binding protein CopC